MVPAADRRHKEMGGVLCPTLRLVHYGGGADISPPPPGLEELQFRPLGLRGF